MGIYDVLKDSAGILKEAGKIDQYRQILEVQEKLLDMQKRISDLENENTELRKKFEIQSVIKFENNAYWIGDDKNSGPLCSRCWDSDRKPIRMQPRGNPTYFDCPNCQNKCVQIYHDTSGRGARPVHVFNPER